MDQIGLMGSMGIYYLINKVDLMGPIRSNLTLDIVGPLDPMCRFIAADGLFAVQYYIEPTVVKYSLASIGSI